VAVPNFLVVGAAKAGTSALSAMLRQHPDVYMPQHKEAHHFLHPDEPAPYRGPGDGLLNSLLRPDWQDYLSLFDAARGERAVGEASVYYMSSPAAVRRIRERLGSVRVVASLRDPARRAFSAYSHLAQEERETLPFAQALEEEHRRAELGWEPLWRYRELGRYAAQVECLLDELGARDVLLVRYDDFSRDPAGELERVFRFLDVDPGFLPDLGVRGNDTGQPRSVRLARLLRRERGPARRALRRLVPRDVRRRIGTAVRDANRRRVEPDAALVQQLREEYRPDVTRLEGLTGWDLSAWK
jgi:hypothetical protein